MKTNLSVQGNSIVLKHKLAKDETYKVKDRKGIFSLNIYKKPQTVRGISSMCDDMKHILMIDWDNTAKWIVEKELKILSDSYSPFYLFVTKEETVKGEVFGHYHAISLQKFTAHQIISIQRETSCDGAYITMPLRNRFRSWVLRQTDKKGSGAPKFKGVIGKKNLNKEISSAHLKVISTIYKVPKIPYKKKDGLKKVYVNQYETGVR